MTVPIITSSPSSSSFSFPCFGSSVFAMLLLLSLFLLSVDPFSFSSMAKMGAPSRGGAPFSMIMATRRRDMVLGSASWERILELPLKLVSVVVVRREGGERRSLLTTQPNPASGGVVVRSMSRPYRHMPASSRSESRAASPARRTVDGSARKASAIWVASSVELLPLLPLCLLVGGMEISNPSSPV